MPNLLAMVGDQDGMTTYTVTTAADAVNADDGVLSLREAVQQASATAVDDDIRFLASLEGQTLTLTQGELALNSYEPGFFSGETRIDGDTDNNGTRVTINANFESRILSVGDLASANIEDTILANGQSDQSGGGIRIGERSNVEISNCEIRNCSSFDFAAGGGGIFADEGSYLQVDRSRIINNSSQTSGGGISGDCRLTISRSIIDGNSAYAGYEDSEGGGIYNEGYTAVSQSLIANNSAGSGGGISGNHVRMESVSVVDNGAGGVIGTEGYYGPGSGGGISGGIIRIYRSTVTGNSSDSGNSGISDEYIEPGPHAIFCNSLSIFDSIVARNGSQPSSVGERESDLDFEIGGSSVVSNSHNIFGSIVRGVVPGDQQLVLADRVFAAVDPETGGGRLAMNGGPVPTVALRDGLDNPALGGAARPPEGTSDARGVARPLPATTNPDIGAFELSQTRVSTQPTDGNDVLTGTAVANTISGLAGVDIVRGLDGDDTLYGNDGGDTLRGEGGNDLLEGGTGSDWLDGGAGIDQISYAKDAYPLGVGIDLVAGSVVRGGETDTLIGIENADGSNFVDAISGNSLANRLGGAGSDDLIRGGAGQDVLAGGLGNDRLYGDGEFDLADFALGSAVSIDLSLANDRATRGAETDLLFDIEGAIGSGVADTFRGDALANLFRGQGGRDAMTGGAGADDFDFDATLHSAVGASRDVITDFAASSDDLDLATIDARSATAATNDAFTFLAARGAAFSAAGQVRWHQSAGNTLVEANVDANLAPDLQIQLTGLKTLTAGDFVL